MTAASIELPDGSVAVVEPLTSRLSLVSREVAGVCVWGQAFQSGEDHEAQVAEVVASMRRAPTAFNRR